jgi:hypothetical protein
MGSYKTLQAFIQWGAATYPADNLAVVIWDHGSGWYETQFQGSSIRANATKSLPLQVGAGASRSLSGVATTGQTPQHVHYISRAVKGRTIIRTTRALSQDFASVDEIETWQMDKALTTTGVQPIDMVVIDCSLQQMLEVAYQIRNLAKVQVGSEDSPPGQGYAYDVWLADLKVKGADPCAVGKDVVDTFVTRYNGSAYEYTDITNSVIDLTKMQNAASALDALGVALNGDLTDGAIATAWTNAQNYAPSEGYQDNKDMYDYAAQLYQNSNATLVKSAATSLQQAIIGTNGCVMYTQHGSYTNASQNDSHSNGIVVWVPQPKDQDWDGNYTSLALASAAPHWETFVQTEGAQQ